jgi:hypothetical protein
VLWLAVIGMGSGAKGVAASDLPEMEGPVMTGELTRQQLETALPGWIEAEVLARPDLASASALGSALVGAEVTVLLGTWCSDSRRELARLWRAFDEAGIPDPVEMRYIGVDREMVEPEEWTAGRNLQLVPTFVVARQGAEVGRIVELAPNGIEKDLLSILLGEATGVISGSDQLEVSEAER